MSLRIIKRCFFVLILLCLVNIVHAADKTNIHKTPISYQTISEIRVLPSLSTADTCIVRHDEGIVYQINGWVYGNELYKSYLDPSLTCDNPYPFTITEINMPMVFSDTTVINVSVDIEKVDYTNPTCPFPDSIISISSAYDLQVPGPGLYDIWIPLDEPLVVNEPFFAGFFIGTITNDSCDAAVVTDTDSTSICESYNIWNDSIGFIDLMNNDFWNFPGQLVLYASGIPGGAANEPEPDIAIISPFVNDKLFGSKEIWTHEKSGSSIIDYVSFEYSSDGITFSEVGRDYDGVTPLRDGTNQTESGNGYSYIWDFSNLTEGNYSLRVSAVDTMGRSSSDEISVFLEPTPPIPTITSPSYGSYFCPNFDILISSGDENLSSIDLYYKESFPNYNNGMEVLNQNDFGNYYSAPIAAALAIKLWADRGYSFIMKDGFNDISLVEQVEIMAAYFNVSANNGSYDELVYSGFQEFNNSKGNALILDYKRSPNYATLRSILEYEEKAVMVALGGSAGRWLAIDGFGGAMLPGGIYPASICNPLTGIIEIVQLRENNGIVEINLTGSWQTVEMLISVGALNWNETKTSIGTDGNGLDGWSYNWTPNALNETSDYFIHAEGTDQTSLNGSSTTMLTYDCSQFFIPGDLNNDGYTNIADLNYLITYYMGSGPAPVGGVIRADTNCDGYLNITDIVYFANFIFGMAPPPCH